MEKVNLQSIKARLNSETPAFWKKIRKVMIALGLVGGAIKAAVETNTILLPKEINPDWINWMILIGVVGTTLSSLTAEKPNVKNEAEN